MRKRRSMVDTKCFTTHCFTGHCEMSRIPRPVDVISTHEYIVIIHSNPAYTHIHTHTHLISPSSRTNIHLITIF